VHNEQVKAGVVGNLSETGCQRLKAPELRLQSALC